MSRGSAGVWRTSRKLCIYLPACPGHLSEPAYANLLFSSHCHVRRHANLSTHCIDRTGAEMSEAKRESHHLGFHGPLLPSMQEDDVGLGGAE